MANAAQGGTAHFDLEAAQKFYVCSVQEETSRSKPIPKFTKKGNENMVKSHK